MSQGSVFRLVRSLLKALDMDLTVYLWALICSRENFFSLELFRKGRDLLEERAGLLSRDFLGQMPGLADLKTRYPSEVLGKLRDSLQKSLDSGDWLLYPDHPQYPIAYLFLEEPPLLLRVRGNPVWKTHPGLAVVGHREPSESTVLWMDRQLSQFIRDRDCMIVSGGARGVDQKAHALALRAGKPTVVLLPSGLDEIYPSSLKSWVPEILKSGGALISEYENERRMQKHYFAQRNRLISGLACATLIIEARLHSGTMLTAHEAIDQGRPLWVLPGHPMDSSFSGSLSLIREGAAPLLDAEDLSLFFDSELQGISGFWRKNSKDLVVSVRGGH